MLVLSFILISQLLVTFYVHAQVEYLRNPDFEDDFGDNDWFCTNCNLSRSTDAYSGNYSAFVYNRNAYWAGLSQLVDLPQNTSYHFSCWVKLLNMAPGSLWHDLDIHLEIIYADGTTDFPWYGKEPYFKPEKGWQEIGGDFYLDHRTINKLRVYFQVDNESIDYLADQASLQDLVPNTNWRAEAEERIAEIRKNNITLNILIGEEYDPSELSIQISQKTKDFAFGSATVGNMLTRTDEYAKKYQDCFYSNFAWSVFEGIMKWHVMEQSRGTINFPDGAVEALKNNNVPLRGHCVFWGMEQYVQDWLKNMTASEIKQELMRRVEYLVPRYEGRITHYDVNNEQLHGSWYESQSHDDTLLLDMFNEIRRRDQHAKLFLNDFQVFNEGWFTHAMVNSANQLLRSGAPLGGIGVQSHVLGGPDLTFITRLLHRMSVLRGVDLPIWITELDIALDNVTERAQAYDDLLTLYYSNPQIEGILLWGFSDQHHHRPNAALFEGENFTPNEAGLRWQELMRDRWNTQVTVTTTEPELSYTIRGFHGEYELTITANDTILYQENFYLHQGNDITLNVEI